jgi:hypothetical protein
MEERQAWAISGVLGVQTELDRESIAAHRKGSPTFRTFVVTNSAVLKDGQSTRFSSATDNVSGETVKVDVMLNVVK